MTPEKPDHALCDAICQYLADAVAVPAANAPATIVTDAPTEGWQVRLAIYGRGPACIWLALPSKDVAVIAGRILGVQNEELEEGVLRDTLRELVAQAASAVVMEPVGAGLDMKIEVVEPTIAGLPTTPPRVRVFDIGSGAKVTLAAWASPRKEEAAGAGAAFSRHEHGSADGEVRHATTNGSDNLDLVLDIDLPMSVRFGRTEMALGALTRLGPGSVIDLGRSPDEPVEMIVSGRVVARGDVVVVGGNFGVRITDVLHAPAARRD